MDDGCQFLNLFYEVLIFFWRGCTHVFCGGRMMWAGRVLSLCLFERCIVKISAWWHGFLFGIKIFKDLGVFFWLCCRISDGLLWLRPCWPCRNWNEEEAERQLFEFTGLLLSFSGAAPVPSLIWSRWSKLWTARSRSNVAGIETFKNGQNPLKKHHSHIRPSWHGRIYRMVLADLCSASPKYLQHLSTAGHGIF